MIKNFLTILFTLVIGISGLNAQLSSSPSPLQEYSQDVIIYFDATGTPLAGINASQKLYAHTGCDLSNGQTWVNGPSWGDNSSKYELTYVSTNKWQLQIGDIRSYYGVTNPDLHVTGLNFVIRTADTTKQTEDLWVEVFDSGLQIVLTSSPGVAILTPATGNVSFKADTTESADITITVNGQTIGSVSNATTLNASYNFTTVGDYTVTATATNASGSASASLDFIFSNGSSMATYPGGKPQMGPVKNADGSVTFCLGAPEKEDVLLVGAWNDYKYTTSQVMNYQDVEVIDTEGNLQTKRYFWTTVKGLDNDTMYGYYFLVDNQIRVGDPYARLVLDPWNDKYLDTEAFTGLPEYPYHLFNNVPIAIYQGSINDYDWKVTDFKGVAPQDLMIYELLFRDFTGTEGKAEGNGTVRQAIEKLPYLIELGINAIEVLPIMEFNGNISWGYNPNFYFAVDKAYGTPDDYKEFIDLCHQNGIAVILDMVFNQSDGLHPWYQMYDIDSNPFYNRNAPHAYSVLNDWNQGTEMVQEQWDDVLRYWMTEYKFDGFRFDLVKGLGNNSSYANSGDAATNAFNQSRVDRMARLHAVMNEINPDAYFINENLAGPQEENAMALDGDLNWANINDPACQFAMGYKSDSNMNRLYAPKDSNRIWGSTVSYLESHDEQRLAFKQNEWGVAGVKGNERISMRRLSAAAAQMIMTPGAHMIWQFSEMGNAQNTKSSNFSDNNTDPKIVNWSLLDKPYHKSLYDSYCQLIALRNQNPDLFTQENSSFEINCGANDWEQGRTIINRVGNQELITVVNPNVSGAYLTVNVEFAVKDNSFYSIVSKFEGSSPSFDAVKGTVTLAPNTYVVIGSHSLASVEEIAKDSDNLLRAYAQAGRIVVDYAPASVNIYSLDGKMVNCLSNPGSVQATPGVYILRSGNEVLKLIVK